MLHTPKPPELIEYDYFFDWLLCLHDPESRYRPCIYGSSISDPENACIGACMWTGAPLREMWYMSEEASGQCMSSSPRPCILCATYRFTNIMQAPLRFTLDKDMLNCVTMQPYRINDKDPRWDPDLIVYQANDGTGHPNRVTAPFINFKNLESRLRCRLNKDTVRLYIELAPA